MTSQSKMNGHSLNRSAIVLYGTETGTSQDLAEEVGRCLERLHFAVDVAGFDTVAFGALRSYTLSVFVIATTGQGDFPANARKLWTSLLKKRLGLETLAGVEYALVGLGDSSYLKFNWAARKLEKRLKQLGAEEIVEACEADEQGDEETDGAFLAWMPGFREAVLGRFPLVEGQEPIPEKEQLPSKWILKQLSNDIPQKNEIEDTGNGVRQKNGLAAPAESFKVVLTENKRVTPAGHWQDVRLLRLRADGYHNYLPGDALAINPENSLKDVETLLNLMNWGDVADLPLAIIPNNFHQRPSPLSHLSGPLALHEKALTLRELLSKHLDINAIPRRSFFSAIAKYTADSMHKERLLEFTDPQYLDEYYDYATRPRRSIVEILQEFDTVKIPWQETINVFPTLRPRQFSIASGGFLKGEANDIGESRDTIFELLIAIVKYKTVIKRIREGICTRYLAQLPVGTRLKVELKQEGRFESKDEIATKKHLLIGAGTGIAPLRALIHEKSEFGLNGGHTTLVFGARNSQLDYFFHDEWSNILSERLEVHTAFSRDQKEKIYVQDRIRDQWQKVSKLMLDPTSTIIVCGASGQMPKAVRQALTDVLTGAARQNSEARAIDGQVTMTSDEAEQFLAQLEKIGRYKQETWS